jgi:hypothetical protein
MSGVLSVTDLLTIADSLAQQAADLAAVTSAGFANNRGDHSRRPTISSSMGYLGAALWQLIPHSRFHRCMRRGMAALKANLGDLSAFLIANDKRVHANLNTLLGAKLNAAVIMAPAMTGSNKLGHFAATGATDRDFYRRRSDRYNEVRQSLAAIEGHARHRWLPGGHDSGKEAWTGRRNRKP